MIEIKFIGKRVDNVEALRLCGYSRLVCPHTYAVD